jgi:hypothetical protein
LRHLINNKFFEQKYNSNYFTGLILFGNKNFKKTGLFNSKIYYVIEDLGNQVIVKNNNGTELERPISKKCFNLGFAVTVHKYQVIVLKKIIIFITLILWMLINYIQLF